MQTPFALKHIRAIANNHPTNSFDSLRFLAIAIIYLGVAIAKPNVKKPSFKARLGHIEQARVYHVLVVWLLGVASKDCEVVRALTALDQPLVYE
jgi:hypothetical protein